MKRQGGFISAEIAAGHEAMTSFIAASHKATSFTTGNSCK